MFSLWVPPSKNPVPLLRIYSSKVFLKACPPCPPELQKSLPWIGLSTWLLLAANTVFLHSIWQNGRFSPLHPYTQDTEIGVGALVWQPQPSFATSDRSCLVAEKSRQNESRIARQRMKTGCERHGERESGRRREDRATKLGRTRKTIRCYQSQQ